VTTKNPIGRPPGGEMKRGRAAEEDRLVTVVHLQAWVKGVSYGACDPEVVEGLTGKSDYEVVRAAAQEVHDQVVSNAWYFQQQAKHLKRWFDLV